MTNAIINSNGTEFNLDQWDAIVSNMDPEIAERLNSELAPCAEQEFFAAYAKAHEDEFGEQWELNKANPVW